MLELVHYLSTFESSVARGIQGVSNVDLVALADRCGAPLPADYADFLRTMGHDSSPLQLFDGQADFRYGAVFDFYSSPGWRPSKGAIFIGADHSGGDLDFFLEPCVLASSMQVVRSLSGEDGLIPIIIHPDFANMLFFLGFLMFRLRRLPHHANLVADERRIWDSALMGTRSDALAFQALELGLTRVPHTGSWSVAHNGPSCGVSYYEAPGYSPTVSVGANSTAQLDEITRRLASSVNLIRVG